MLRQTPNGEHLLRSYIFPAAPATRCPCDGTESEMRIEFGFTPRWYHKACGVDFSERWHLDPEYRRDTVVAMRQELNRRFPSLRLGGPDPEACPATLDGLHGALTMALLFGIPVDYYVDNWPAARHQFLTRDQAAMLDVPALGERPVWAQLEEQMAAIERRWGRIEGYINWQGVLNNAYRLRGQALFTDLLEDPALAHHVFDVVARTMIACARRVYERQRRSGFIVRHFTVSNCLVNMLHPQQYRYYLMPYDKRISAAFEHFGIHNCAWNVDPYIEDYAGIRTLGYVDMGLESDLARVKRLCPNTRRAVMYKPTDLANKPLEDIWEDLVRIRRQLSPCDIVMADIDAGTPDERVAAFARLAEESLAIAPDPTP